MQTLFQIYCTHYIFSIQSNKVLNRELDQTTGIENEILAKFKLLMIVQNLTKILAFELLDPKVLLTAANTIQSYKV